MKIAVIQASSQKEKNTLLYESVKEAVQKHAYEVINFGVFENEETNYSYIEIAIQIGLLIESGAVDFVVTGCSSGQGMMLACNTLPNLCCGYIVSPSDAYLFGRINDGNAVSFPLGLHFGWAGELNLKYCLEKLFDEDFGIGYPLQDSERKKKDTQLLKRINKISKKSMTEILPQLDKEIVQSALSRKNVIDYILEYGSNVELVKSYVRMMLQKEK